MTRQNLRLPAWSRWPATMMLIPLSSAFLIQLSWTTDQSSGCTIGMHQGGFIQALSGCPGLSPTALLKLKPLGHLSAPRLVCTFVKLTARSSCKIPMHPLQFFCSPTAAPVKSPCPMIETPAEHVMSINASCALGTWHSVVATSFFTAMEIFTC